MNSPAYRVQVIQAGQLPEFVPDWTQLADNAIEPNPFYEPWMLLPALGAVEEGNDIQAALVWHQNPSNSKEKPLLVGFFPFTSGRRFRRLPVSVSKALAHIYCFLGTPLLHREHASSALEAYFDWHYSPASGAKLVSFHKLPADGPVHQLIVELIYARSLTHYVDQRYTRALFKRPDDAVKYISARISSKSMQQYRRKRERLAELGALDVRCLAAGDDVTGWIDAFLALEASGWKGAVGTALAASESHAAFFRAAATAAHEKGKLKMSGLWLDGRPVASRVSFRAGEGTFLFKLAYDEEFSKYSPGMLLELEFIHAGVEGPDQWEDSCNSAENTVYKRMWAHRRTIEDIAISPGSGYGDILLAILPFLGFVKTRLGRIMRRVSRSGTPKAHESGD